MMRGERNPDKSKEQNDLFITPYWHFSKLDMQKTVRKSGSPKVRKMAVPDILLLLQDSLQKKYINGQESFSG
jgi:hypothetical protein